VTSPISETPSIGALVADWLSATSSRMRITTELFFADARLAAISVTLMVLMGVLSAVFLLGAWGLAVAGLVAVALQFGIALWLTLASLGLLHAIGAWLLWRGAVGISRYLNFAATRQQFRESEVVHNDVDTATAAR
jgi:ABC-type nickel/cobalt efflux system permease component RcnA